MLKGDLVADTVKEGEENSKSTGLFQLRNTNNEKIKEYIEKESDIKTNAKEEKEVIKKDIARMINTDAGKPINTADILEKLKSLQQSIKKEVEENPSIKLNENYLQMRENIKRDEDNKSIPVSAEIVEEHNDVEEKNNTNGLDDLNNKTADSSDISILNDKEEKYDLEGNVVIDKELNAEQKQLEANSSQNDDVIDENMVEKQKNTNEETSKSIEDKELQNKKEELKEIEKQIEKIQETPQDEKIDFDEMYQKLFKTKPIKDEEIEEKDDKVDAIDIVKDNTSLFENIEEYKKIPYKFIGIVFKTYIILEMGKEMYILDQHAAHERILYEKVKKNYYSDASKDSQMLLLPDIITLTHKEMDIAKENMSMFEKAGFSLEEFGENTIKLTGVPTVCIDLDTKDLFLETLDEINTVARTAKQEKEERFIATVACKAAVKAHMALTAEEVDSLMDKLLQLPNPFTCPHGRPTAIKMTQYDIEKKFARKL